MRFWLSLMPIYETDQLVPIAQKAEALGFYGITLPDHLVMPTRIESRYPYTEDGQMWFPKDLPWLDPWITLTAMGCATRHLKLGTNIYLAALRDPFTAAKALATVATLLGDRVMGGFSVGWIKEEYDLLGLDFPSRGRRMDEMIAVMKQLWRGEEIHHAGEFFRFEHAIMRPAPAQPIPILCGGASAPALRRAAMNDGWLGVPMTLKQLRPTVATLQRIRQEAGLPLENFTVLAAYLGPMTPDALAELEAMGVHDMTVMAPWMLSPWGERRFVDEGADIRRLDVKTLAMERFAEAALTP